MKFDAERERGERGNLSHGGVNYSFINLRAAKCDRAAAEKPLASESLDPDRTWQSRDAPASAESDRRCRGRSFLCAIA